MYTIQRPVGKNAPNQPADVQTVQMLFNDSGFLPEVGYQRIPVSGNVSVVLEGVIHAFQQVKVREQRPYWEMVCPGSVTLQKLNEMAKTNAPGEKEWAALTVSQRQAWDENANRLKIEKENRRSMLYQMGQVMENLLNTCPAAKAFIEKLVGTQDTGVSLVQLALGSAQLVTYFSICWKLGLRPEHIVAAFKLLIGAGTPGVRMIERITNGVMLGSFGDVLLRYKSMLGSVSIFLTLMKALLQFSDGKWGPAFGELVKGMFMLAVPVAGFIDALLSVVEFFFPSLKGNPLWDFIKRLNPADMIKDAVAGVLATIGLFWEAWTRNDWNVWEVAKNAVVMIGGGILQKGAESVMDVLYKGWRALQWIINLVTGSTQTAANLSPASAMAFA